MQSVVIDDPSRCPQGWALLALRRRRDGPQQWRAVPPNPAPGTGATGGSRRPMRPAHPLVGAAREAEIAAARREKRAPRLGSKGGTWRPIARIDRAVGDADVRVLGDAVGALARRLCDGKSALPAILPALAACGAVRGHEHRYWIDTEAARSAVLPCSAWSCWASVGFRLRCPRSQWRGSDRMLAARSLPALRCWRDRGRVDARAWGLPVVTLAAWLGRGDRRHRPSWLA